MTQPSYPACARSTSLSDDLTGQISVTPAALIFETDDGTQKLELPWSRVRLEQPESGWFRFADPEQSWEIYTRHARLFDHPIFNQRNNLRSQLRAVRRQGESKRVMKFSILFLICFGVVALLTAFLTKWTVRFLVSQVPVAWEARLANSILKEMEPRPREVHDPQAKADLAVITDRLVNALPRQRYRFQFHIIEHPEANAFALPGGTIFVHTGLLKVAARPEEIAGVLAHEIAHVNLRHGLRQIVASVGPYYLLQVFVGGRQGFMSVITSGSELLVRQSFSREAETEADEEAWKYLLAANIDPRGLAECLRTIAQNPRTAAFEESPLQVLNSHPPTAERIQHLHALWQKSSQQTRFVEITRPSP